MKQEGYVVPTGFRLVKRNNLRPGQWFVYARTRESDYEYATVYRVPLNGDPRGSPSGVPDAFKTIFKLRSIATDWSTKPTFSNFTLIPCTTAASIGGAKIAAASRALQQFVKEVNTK